MKAKNVLDKLKDLKLRRWGPAEYTEAKNSNGESDNDSDIFFVPATIQPKYFIDENATEPIEIKNYTSDITWAAFLYNKEDIISLGIEEGELNSLTQVTIDEAHTDSLLQSPTKGLFINKEVFKNTLILSEIAQGNESMSGNVGIYNPDNRNNYIVYKISDDVFYITPWEYHSPLG